MRATTWRTWSGGLAWIALATALVGFFEQEVAAQDKPAVPRILQRKPAGNDEPGPRLQPLGVIHDGIAVARPRNWKQTLLAELPKYGHRNWIVIADAAYPSQTSPGIQTVWTDEDHIQVLKVVLAELGKTRHVRPVVHVDEELNAVSNDDAPGIEALRKELHAVLDKQTVQSLPHEAIIGKLDEAGKQFHVLVLKTNLTLPYTSVFLQLDCGYWSPEAEQRLRKALKP